MTSKPDRHNSQLLIVSSIIPIQMNIIKERICTSGNNREEERERERERESLWERERRDWESEKVSEKERKGDRRNENERLL